MTKKEKLEILINYHDELYWDQNNPEISDVEYDKLVEDLRILDPNSHILKKVHSIPVTLSSKVKHAFPMLSLDKVYTIEELLKWCNKVARNENEEFLIQPKLDGCSAELSNSILGTRGDGYEGEDITNKLPIIKTKSSEGYIEEYNNLDYVRGEIVLSKSEFETFKDRLLRKGGQQYKTVRNACSGILNRDDLDISLGRVLTLVPFDLISRKLKLSELREMDWNNEITIIQGLDYPTDGIVIKLANTEYSKSLGNTSHHPRGELALKFTNPTGTTVLRSVDWSSGKRKLTPIGKVDPVEIGGVIVSNVNLHNYNYILDNNIYLLDTLVIERCGDIIPDVKEVIPGLYRQSIEISNCPYCGSVIIHKAPEVYCVNDNCIGKHIQMLSDSVVRIGIERLGEPTLAKLIDKGFDTLIKILNLTTTDILSLDGFAKTSSSNLFNEIQKVAKGGVYEWQILASLNIKDVGVRMSKIILENIKLQQLRNIPMDELETIAGVGVERSQRIFYGLEEASDYINELLTILPIKEKVKMESKTICFTGKMPEKRAYYEALAKDYGYEPTKSATKSLSILVCMDPNSNSGKLKNAMKNGTEIISVQEFMDRMFTAMERS